MAKISLNSAADIFSSLAKNDTIFFVRAIKIGINCRTHKAFSIVFNRNNSSTDAFSTHYEPHNPFFQVTHYSRECVVVGWSSVISAMTFLQKLF
jgi:hypothetical protein